MMTLLKDLTQARFTQSRQSKQNKTRVERL